MSDDNKLNTYLNSPVTDANPELDKHILDQILAEDKKQQQYGDKPIEAFVNRAASAATFGLSTELAKAAGVPEERLREVPERNEFAGGAGTVTGVILPAIASGGESLAAKVLGGPLKALGEAGNIAGQGVEKLVEGRVRSQAVKAILKDVTSNAVEGAAFGAGNVVDEHALGKADLTAQNLVAGAGAGAMFGGLAGGAIGGAKAVAPFVEKGIAPIANKLKSAAKNVVDPEAAALDLLGIDAKTAYKESQYHPTFATDMPDYLVNKLGLKVGQSTEERMVLNEKVREAAGQQIGDVIKQMDEATVATPAMLPNRFEVGKRLEQHIDNAIKDFKLSSNTNSAELSALKAFQRDIEKLAIKEEPLMLSDLNQLRKNYQKIKFSPTGSIKDNFRANIANTLRGELRNIIDESATRIGSESANPALQNLAAQLKSANKDFAMASTVAKHLPKKLNQASAVNLIDLVKGGLVGGLVHSTPVGALVAGASKFARSDTKRILTVLADLKTQNMAISDAVKASVGNFVRRTGKAGKQLSLKSLSNSGFAVDYDTKQPPKNNREAFKNIGANLERLKGNDELMIDRLAKSTARISAVAPQVTQEVHNTLIRSANFLDAKIPKDPNPRLIFAKEYVPSSLEVAKFERYVQAVEHPMTVLQDIESGTLTREHVEALASVYPALYEHIRQEVLEQATAPTSTMTYAKKLQLGILLDIPTDPSLEGRNIAGLQVNFMPQNDPMQVEAQQGSMRQGSQVGLQKLDSASRAATDTENIANRKQV